MNRYDEYVARRMFAGRALASVVSAWEEVTSVVMNEWTLSDADDGLPELEAALEAAHRGRSADLPDHALLAVHDLAERNAASRGRRASRRIVMFTAEERTAIFHEVIRRALAWKAAQS